MASVRYFVSDVERSIDYYTRRLSFTLKQQAGTAIAGVERGDLTLWLSGPDSSAGRPVADGRRAVPGGWNRIVIEVADLPARIAELSRAGVQFRGDIVGGSGGKKALVS